MTYHLKQMKNTSKAGFESMDDRFPMDFLLPAKVRFPLKLYEILQEPKTSNSLLWWSNDGSTVIADSERFEQQVMGRYPDFVRISSFANFRRQMRIYNFVWHYESEEDIFTFTHPYFKRGRDDLLDRVVSSNRREVCMKRGPKPKYVVLGTEQEDTADNYDYSPVSDSKVGLVSDNTTGEQIQPKKRKYATKKQSSTSVAVQTSITMSPDGTEFIGAVNDGQFYYDFYTTCTTAIPLYPMSPNLASQQIYNVVSPQQQQHQMHSPPVFSPLPSPYHFTLASPAPMPTNIITLPNNAVPVYQDALTSPEQRCLVGYQTPVSSSNPFFSPPNSVKSGSGRTPNGSQKSNGSADTPDDKYMKL